MSTFCGSRKLFPPCANQLSIRSITPDRKSTRLNSSHSQISYPAFCLKKNLRSEIIRPACGHRAEAFAVTHQTDKRDGGHQRRQRTAWTHLTETLLEDHPDR